MKKILIFSLTIISLNCLAQETRLNTIKPVKAGATVHEQAFESIVANNKLEPNAKTHYEAGKYITMLPGFEAKASTVYKANIAEIDANNEKTTISIKAFPNPFINLTEIEFYLPKPAKASIIIYSELGLTISKLADNQSFEKGNNKIQFTNKDLTPGIYLASIITENEEKVSVKLEMK